MAGEFSNLTTTAPESLQFQRMEKVVIVESKSTSKNIWGNWKRWVKTGNEYESVFGYSIGETEPLVQLYEYPEYDFDMTGEMTNLELEEAKIKI